MNYFDFDDYWRPLLGGQGPFGTYVATLTVEMRHKIEEAVGAPTVPVHLTANGR